MKTEKSKKTEVITFRTSPEIKTILEAEAEKREWSLSQLVERIVAEHAIGEKKNTVINLDIQKNHTINFNGG